MPNENDNNENENEDVSIEDLRAAANRSQQNAQAAAAAQRELALVKAGIDTESPTGKLILNAYDGELNTEAIREFCKDIPGALPPVQQEEQQQEQQDPNASEQQRQTDERNRLAGDARGDILPGTNYRDEAKTTFEEAVKSGLPLEEARARQFNTLVAGAMSGDSAVILNDPVEKK